MIEKKDRKHLGDKCLLATVVQTEIDISPRIESNVMLYNTYADYYYYYYSARFSTPFEVS